MASQATAARGQALPTRRAASASRFPSLSDIFSKDTAINAAAAAAVVLGVQFLASKIRSRNSTSKASTPGRPDVATSGPVDGPSLHLPESTRKELAAMESRLRREMRRAAAAPLSPTKGGVVVPGASGIAVAETPPRRLTSPGTSSSPPRALIETTMGFKMYPATAELSRSEQKRILVTGGAGFVGSHLVDALMVQGHMVYVLDNLFTGRRANIAHWFGHPNFEFFQHDVINPFFLEVDEIYHLACPASPPHYQYNPIKTVKCSTMGTINMLGLAKRCKARMLFTSTSEVYGDPEVHPQVETYWGNVNCIGPRACYDEGKRVAETLCYSYLGEGHVDVRVARIFNTFGPRMHPDDGRVVSNFIKQALQGDSLTVYGDGAQTRSFQYVSDLVRGLIALMASDYSQPVNIGNPEEFTIKHFAEYIVKKVNPTDGKVIHKPATQDDPRRRRPDTTVAKTRLDWEPEVPVEEGLDKTILYFRYELGLPLEEDQKIPVVWMPEIPDLHLGCMAERREPPVYK